MERGYVDSSNLASVGFDNEQSILEVEFKKDGAIWQYYDVEDSVYYELMAADSIGSYFYHNIRVRGYQAVRIN
ncbi:KTSC domain-containing protein [Enterococcus hirae]|uniref:KTSC domain-containing protein n=1 Tax=Enterococcus hirae TaxID=1354 RepID=UPI0015F271AB|nr:KTSC domain-containing protein [Enterococcus hirae]MBA5268822.1 KTSC domain-containing protein [Enterococcus hirae]